MAVFLGRETVREDPVQVLPGDPHSGVLDLDDGSLVAVDGDAGVGKSTVARLLAERLGLRYVNTGAMYRAIAWVTQAGYDLEDIQIALEGEDVCVNGCNKT